MSKCNLESHLLGLIYTMWQLGQIKGKKNHVCELRHIKVGQLYIFDRFTKRLH